MSEEKQNNTDVKECQCFCKSEGVRNFLICALGTFVGVYCALSLFCALHRPPMPYNFGGFAPIPHHHIHHGIADFHKFKKHHMKNFDTDKPPIADYSKKSAEED